MAQFRGIIRGPRGEASRLGSKASGLTVEAASWQGKVVTRVWHDSSTDKDMVEVTLDKHHGAGVQMLLFRGPIGEPRTTLALGQGFNTIAAVAGGR